MSNGTCIFSGFIFVTQQLLVVGFKEKLAMSLQSICLLKREHPIGSIIFQHFCAQLASLINTVKHLLAPSSTSLPAGDKNQEGRKGMTEAKGSAFPDYIFLDYYINYYYSLKFFICLYTLYLCQLLSHKGEFPFPKLFPAMCFTLHTQEQSPCQVSMSFIVKLRLNGSGSPYPVKTQHRLDEDQGSPDSALGPQSYPPAYYSLHHIKMEYIACYGSIKLPAQL